MYILFRGIEISAPTQNGYFSIIDPEDRKRILMFNEPGGFVDPVNSVPMKSASGRIFLAHQPDDCDSEISSRCFFLVPDTTQIGVETNGASIIKTEHEEYVILDAAHVTDEIFVLRWFCDYDEVYRYAVVCTATDAPYRFFASTDEYDAFVSSGGFRKCVGYYPPVSFDNVDKGYEVDPQYWKSVLSLEETK